MEKHQDKKINNKYRIIKGTINYWDMCCAINCIDIHISKDLGGS